MKGMFSNRFPKYLLDAVQAATAEGASAGKKPFPCRNMDLHSHACSHIKLQACVQHVSWDDTRLDWQICLSYSV